MRKQEGVTVGCQEDLISAGLQLRNLVPLHRIHYTQIVNPNHYKHINKTTNISSELEDTGVLLCLVSQDTSVPMWSSSSSPCSQA